MVATIKLRFGNMFDGPSDLIVLPCNTNGGVTGFVGDHLRNFLLPAPRASLELGEVEIIPFAGGENIAQYVAYAASVDADLEGTTAAETIEKIGIQLGDTTRELGSVRAIAAPLLGAGAGGLTSEKSVLALRAGFISCAAEEAVLTINVLHKPVFDRLREFLSDLIITQADLVSPFYGTSAKEIRRKNFRVFISYTNTKPSHMQWVENLAKYLRKNGVETRLDIWHLRHGMDLPQWMVNELQLADKVIIISDETYAQKADGRHGGVGWETMVIQGDMANLPPDSTKYITIVREANFKGGLPTYLKTKFAFHWPENGDEEKLRNDLLKELLGVSNEPPIGEPPVFF